MVLSGRVDAGSLIGVKCILLTAGLAGLMASQLRSEISLLVPDELGTACNAATRAIGEGKPWGEVADSLEAVAARLPQSRWYASAVDLAREFRKTEASLRRAVDEGDTKATAPWRWLAESKMPAHFAFYAESEPLLRQFMDEQRDDPATMLIMAGRGSIEKLLSLLMDQAPTRKPIEPGGTHIQRVSDLALGIIERLSGCSFCDERFWLGTFSGLEEKMRLRAMEAAEAWWKNSGQLGYSEGIRVHMPNAGYYGSIRMAGILAKTGNKEDLKFARRALRKLVSQGYGVSVAAEALWDMGDRYGVDVFRRTYEKRIKKGAFGFIVDDEDAFFLSRR